MEEEVKENKFECEACEGTGLLYLYGSLEEIMPCPRCTHIPIETKTTARGFVIRESVTPRLKKKMINLYNRGLSPRAITFFFGSKLRLKLTEHMVRSCLKETVGPLRSRNETVKLHTINPELRTIRKGGRFSHLK